MLWVFAVLEVPTCLLVNHHTSRMQTVCLYLGNLAPRIRRQLLIFASFRRLWLRRRTIRRLNK